MHISAYKFNFVLIFKATLLCLHYALHLKWTVVTEGDAKTVNVLTGEASASTMWDNQAWSYLHRDREETEPPFLAQDFIHAVQPGAKIIIMLRDPVERYCTEKSIHTSGYRRGLLFALDCFLGIFLEFVIVAEHISFKSQLRLFIQQSVFLWLQLAYTFVSFCSQALFWLPVL